MKFKEVKIGGDEIEHVVGRICGGSGGDIESRGQQSANRGALLEADLRRRGSIEHGSAVVSASIRARKGRAAGEHVEGYVVRVGPDRHLGIVVEVRVLERVAVVSSRFVGSCRDRNALKVGSRRNRELTEDPALG